jgi:hypothetical protein
MEDIGLCILWPFVQFLGHFNLFYGHLIYFVVIWYIVIVLVYCTKKNLANLHLTAVKMLQEADLAFFDLYAFYIPTPVKLRHALNLSLSLSLSHALFVGLH